MAEKTEAQKRAHKKYMEKFVEIKFRTTAEHREIIKAFAAKNGESATGFIVRAINETMEREQ